MKSSSRVIMRIRIERERQRLHLLVQRYGELSHPSVLKQSTRLDELLNLHHKMQKEKLKKPIA